MSSAADRVAAYWHDLELASVAELVQLCGVEEAQLTLVPILSLTRDVMLRCLILQGVIREVRYNQETLN